MLLSQVPGLFGEVCHVEPAGGIEDKPVKGAEVHKMRIGICRGGVRAAHTQTAKIQNF